MKRYLWSPVLTAVLAALLPCALASAQDLHKTYNIASGGHIVLQNISGEIKITGYGGSTIVVDAVRVGRDRDLVKIEETSTDNQLELRVQYPESCNCQASVNFAVQVPAGVDFNFDRVGSVSGPIGISDVQGLIHANTVSGSISMQNVSGTVEASTVSGKVDAQLQRVSGTGALKFTSVSGSIQARIPAGGLGNVDMSTLSGGIETDFPIAVEENRPGRSAHGTVGTGSNSIHITTVSGKINLFKN